MISHVYLYIGQVNQKQFFYFLLFFYFFIFFVKANSTKTHKRLLNYNLTSIRKNFEHSKNEINLAKRPK